MKKFPVRPVNALAAGDPGAPASPIGPLQLGSLERQAGPRAPGGPFWFHARAVVPLAHFLPGLLTVRAPFLPTQPRILPSEPVKLVAANAPPPNARKTAMVAITFAYV